MRQAFIVVYFPTSLKLSQLLDLGYFPANHAMLYDFEANSGSDSNLDLGTYTSSDGNNSDDDSNSDIDSSSSSAFSMSSNDSDRAKPLGHEQHVDIVWTKANRGVWGVAHAFQSKLCLTRDLIDECEPCNSTIATDFDAPPQSQELNGALLCSDSLCLLAGRAHNTLAIARATPHAGTIRFLTFSVAQGGRGDRYGARGASIVVPMLSLRWVAGGHRSMATLPGPVTC